MFILHIIIRYFSWSVGFSWRPSVPAPPLIKARLIRYLYVYVHTHTRVSVRVFCIIFFMVRLYPGLAKAHKDSSFWQREYFKM